MKVLFYARTFLEIGSVTENGMQCRNEKLFLVLADIK